MENVKEQNKFNIHVYKQKHFQKEKKTREAKNGTV